MIADEVVKRKTNCKNLFRYFLLVLENISAEVFNISYLVLKLLNQGKSPL